MRVRCSNLDCDERHLWECPVGALGVADALAASSWNTIQGMLISPIEPDVALRRLRGRTCAAHRADIDAWLEARPEAGA